MIDNGELHRNIEKARELLDDIYVQLEDHLGNLKYGSVVYWNIVDKMSAISDVMNTL